MNDAGHPLDRRVLMMWWSLSGGGVGCAALLGGVAAWFGPVPVGPVVTLVLLGIVAAALIPPLRYRRWRYGLRERDLSLSRGALWQVRTLIPFDRIQFVESRRGPLDRLFGLNVLVVYTAAGRAAHIPGLNPSQAEAVREELAKVAGTLTV
ncbi:MAG: PH domain-containing protein [Actinobacteria bacterium]|nr:PH domain-containing protein [Actinomycetota bacterium]